MKKKLQIDLINNIINIFDEKYSVYWCIKIAGSNRTWIPQASWGFFNKL